VWVHEEHRADRQRHLSADRIGHQGTAALVGNVRELHLLRAGDLRHRQVPKAAGADRSEGHGLFFRRGEHVAEIAVGLRRVRDDRHRRRADQHHRRDVLQRVEGNVRDERRIHGVRIEDDAQRVAVGRRGGDGLRADGSGCAAAILDHELLAELRRELRGEDARDLVDRAARREGDDDLHRLRGPRLRERGERRCQHRGKQRDQERSLHRNPHANMNRKVGE
jgi:hypothetical protein